MYMNCLAVVIFPIRFSQEAIGGAAYQLPNSYQVRYRHNKPPPNCNTKSRKELLLSGWYFLHFFRDVPVDHDYIRVVRQQGLPPAFLEFCRFPSDPRSVHIWLISRSPALDRQMSVVCRRQQFLKLCQQFLKLQVLWLSVSFRYGKWVVPLILLLWLLEY